MKANKKGLYILPANKKIVGYSVYDLWNAETFVCSAFGPMAVMVLGLAAEKLNGTVPGEDFTGLDWLLLDVDVRYEFASDEIAARAASLAFPGMVGDNYRFENQATLVLINPTLGRILFAECAWDQYHIRYRQKQ